MKRNKFGDNNIDPTARHQMLINVNKLKVSNIGVTAKINHLKFNFFQALNE